MKLTYYKSDPTNFGDELNAYMWPRVLPPHFLDEDSSTLFVGIGSILGEMFPSQSEKFVFGSGIGGYVPAPDLVNGKWNIVFVRGPRTAAQLGLPPEMAICDSAILIRTITDLPKPAKGIDIAFMPHIDSLQRGNWKEVCRLAGLTFLDPTDPPEKLISMIRGARLVITEAMHGAIVSDALRTPWVAVRPFHPSHRNKWADWSEALDFNVVWHKLWPTSVRELITEVVGRGGHRLQAARWPDAKLFAPLRTLIARSAAAKLKRLSQSAKGQLSSDQSIERATAAAKQRVDEFVAAHRTRST